MAKNQNTNDADNAANKPLEGEPERKPAEDAASADAVAASEEQQAATGGKIDPSDFPVNTLYANRNVNHDGHSYKKGDEIKPEHTKELQAKGFAGSKRTITVID